MLSTSSTSGGSSGNPTYEDLELRILQLEQDVAAEKAALDVVEADTADPVSPAFSIVTITNFLQDAFNNIVNDFSALQSLTRNGNSVDVSDDLTVGGKLWIPTSAEAVMGIEDIETRVFNRVGEFDFQTTITNNDMYEGQTLPPTGDIVQADHDTIFSDTFTYRIWDDYTNLGGRTPMVFPPGKYFFHIHLAAHGFFRIQRFTGLIKCRKVSDDSLTYETAHIQYRPHASYESERMSGVGIPATFFRAITEDEYLDIELETKLAPYKDAINPSPSAVTIMVRVTRIAPI